MSEGSPNDYTLNVITGALQDCVFLCYRCAVEKGWWDDPRSDGECIALMHSELSEALEALRTDPNAPCDKGIPITALEEELADLLIRVFDFAGRHNLDLAKALVEKYKYNLTRPYKHGKRF